MAGTNSQRIRLGLVGIGKIGDIFAHSGVAETRKGAGNMALFDKAGTPVEQIQVVLFPHPNTRYDHIARVYEVGEFEGRIYIVMEFIQGETLRAWLLHHGRRDQVAAELHVHPQTVRYRLGGLREALGEDIEPRLRELLKGAS